MAITLLMASVYNFKTSMPPSEQSRARHDAVLVCQLNAMRATRSKLSGQLSVFDKVVIGFLVLCLTSSEVSVAFALRVTARWADEFPFHSLASSWRLRSGENACSRLLCISAVCR